LGYPVDSVDVCEAVCRVGSFIKTGGFHHVVAINANKLWLAEKCPDLRKILWNADLIIPEYAVVWASRKLGKPLKGHVGGVMLLKALVPGFANPRTAWMVLAMASTLAGNLTITGSVANIIVVETAKPEVEVGFKDYLKAGVPITVMTLLAGWAWLSWFA